MEPIKVDFSKSGSKGSKSAYIVPDKSGLKIVLSIILTIVTAAVAYYFMLPALNFKSYDFYMYVAIILGAYVIWNGLFARVLTRPEYVPYVKRRALVPIIILVIFAVIFGIGYLVSAPFFRAKSYSQIIEVEEYDPESEDSNNAINKITNIDKLSDFNKIALIDASAAERLADKTLGALAEYNLESQFEVLNYYSTQINYQNSPYRVFPLRYGDVFKWLKNRTDGTAGYITVNMNTQESEFVKTEEGIKYTPAEHFDRHLKRVVRFKYPTYLIGNISFEIDEQGNPYWLVQHLDKRVGLFGGDDVVGIILVDACTGECVEYTIDEVHAGEANDGTFLEWVDSVYDGDLLIQQYDYKYKYSNGFINFYIGQEGVKLTTAGYAYLTDGNDVYMYTGVTSANTDESILGFALVNQRTKEAYFYSVSGATEAAAQLSAQGIVSDKGWIATFPLLINLRATDGDYVPTYFMALKDNNNVIKSYAMVNVAQYSDAVRSPSDDNPDLKACLQAYTNKLASRSTPVNITVSMTGSLNTPAENEDDLGDKAIVTGPVTDIKAVIIAGNTYFYVTIDSKVYRIAATIDNALIFATVGDFISLEYVESDDEIIEAIVVPHPENTVEEPVTTN
ncbi:MAG TPA: CvpA family protein [Clostridiales bacterium]|nr:CvpA family protein [Clostridiales bacterium]